MPVDPLKDYPGYALRRASVAAMAELARKLAVLDLRPTEATVLVVIAANVKITQSELVKMLDMASANMAPLVSRLEARGLIEREPVDGRSQGLSLSTAGHGFVARVKKIIDAHEDGLLAKLPASQRGAFVAALRALWSES